jgi:hypothetical protein
MCAIRVRYQDLKVVDVRGPTLPDAALGISLTSGSVSGRHTTGVIWDRQR